MAFVAGRSDFAWGGAVGKMISSWMVNFIGSIGTAAIILVAGLAYFIWRFNPVFKVPKLPERKAKLVPIVTPNDNVTGKKSDNNEEPKLFIQQPSEDNSGNMLKSEGGIVVIQPKSEERFASDLKSS